MPKPTCDYLNQIEFGGWWITWPDPFTIYNPNLGMNNTLLEDKYSIAPLKWFDNHAQYDVNPYLLGGNASYPIDPTNSNQRWERFLYKPKK